MILWQNQYLGFPIIYPCW